ncbi:very short patch repair endonuclease [Kitasatospora sp. NPDC091207]|uniref:very short patch repair endonuclease n=1 Tax=Kitasatospora sp. NPDC091207 TaxID=3364083 RepID=UPI00382A75A3
MAEKNTSRSLEKAAPDQSWRPRRGLSRAQLSREQDRAAGGAGRRLVDAGAGRLRSATVVLSRSGRTGRVRVALRWSVDGRSKYVPLGEADRPTRAENLRQGWRLAAASGLLSSALVAEGSWASSPGTRKSMQGNKGKNTKPELRLRSLLHREGLRYRVSIRPVPTLRRTADIVFTKVKVAVFVDGCYWHGCAEHRSVPETNRDFWTEKIEGNKARDAETDHLLEQAGWKVLRIWEHVPAEEAARLVIETVAAERLRSMR